MRTTAVTTRSSTGNTTTTGDAVPAVADPVPTWLRTASGWSWRLLVVFAAIAVFAYALANLRVIVLPVVLALVLATMLARPMLGLRRRGVPRGLAAAIPLFGAIIVLSALIALFAQQAVNQVDRLGEDLDSTLAEVDRWFDREPLGISGIDTEDIRGDIVDEADSHRGAVLSGALSGAAIAMELVAGLLLTVVLLFFFLKEGDRMWEWLVARVALRRRKRFDAAGHASWEALGGYLRGVSIVAAVDAVAIGGALVLLGVPLAIPLAIITFLGGFFPIVGAVVTGMLAALIALITEGPVIALVVVGVVVLVQQLEGDLLQPIVVGRRVNLHPVVVLVALAIGGVLYGVLGALLATPIVAVANAAGSEMRAPELLEDDDVVPGPEPAPA